MQKKGSGNEPSKISRINFPYEKSMMLPTIKDATDRLRFLNLRRRTGKHVTVFCRFVVILSREKYCLRLVYICNKRQIKSLSN